MALHTNDLNDLKRAKTLLENPGIAAKITSALGTPIEKGFALLPDEWKARVMVLTQTALSKALTAALYTMKEDSSDTASNLWHKIAVAATGSVGGFFGLPALAVELPVTTTIMLRSIADVALSEGESLSSESARMACLEVFALGGPGTADDAAESGYFAVRTALAQSVSTAAEHLAQKGLAEEGTPALVRLIVQIAERFSIQVSEKTAAQAVPAIGAAGGALINTLFIDHFQNMARGHFIVRRLERHYGREIIRSTYDSI